MPAAAAPALDQPAFAASTARLRVPWAVQACAAVCGLLAAGYVGTYVVLRIVQPTLASAMLRLFGLTIVAGRETALYDAQHNGMPLPWALALSYADDIASLLLSLVVFWFLLEALHRAAWARWRLARLEKQALRHRAWIQKWGLAGLAVFYFLPGFGSGVAVTAALGILARIRIARMAVVLSLAVLLVDTVWAVLLSFPAHAVPQGGWFDWIPAVVVGLVAASALIGIWRDRKHRHIVLLDWDPHPSPTQAEHMAPLGIRVHDALVEVDTRKLAQATGVRKRRLLFAAELLLLSRMTPDMARRLVERGVTGVRDVARLPSESLAWMAGAEAVPLASAWRGQAMAMVALAGKSWSEA